MADPAYFFGGGVFGVASVLPVFGAGIGCTVLCHCSPLASLDEVVVAAGCALGDVVVEAVVVEVLVVLLFGGGAGIGWMVLCHPSVPAPEPVEEGCGAAMAAMLQITASAARVWRIMTSLLWWKLPVRAGALRGTEIVDDWTCIDAKPRRRMHHAVVSSKAVKP